MHCPYCSTEDTKVIDSRLTSDGGEVRRRRECLNCHERFTTYERSELTYPSVKKNDGSLAEFSEAKLRKGIMRALKKRSVEAESVDAAVTRILQKLLASSDREVESKQIGEWVIEELALIDDVAYVRFASVSGCVSARTRPAETQTQKERIQHQYCEDQQTFLNIRQ
jgi:transcriptional repressor NrdR